MSIFSCITKFFLRMSQKGFTLIELLIVIAVLGVLSSVVLVAIDPLEQIARSTDAGKLSSLSQLGRAMESYVIGQGQGVYPATGTDWQTRILVGSGSIKSVLRTSDKPFPCYGPDNEGNFCYSQIGSNNGMMWIYVESKTEKTRANCPSTQSPAYAWVAAQGRSGLGCIGNAIDPNMSLK